MGAYPDRERFARVPVAAASDSQLKARHLRVLTALCTYVNKAGLAWPSQGTLADHTGYRRQHVNGVIKDLLEFGYIEHAAPTEIAGGGVRSRTYRVCYDATPSVRTDQTPSVANECPQTEDTCPQNGPLPVRSEATQTAQEASQLEQPIDITAPEKNLSEVDLINGDEVGQAFMAWGELADEVGLAKAQRLSDDRRKALGQRLTECGGIDGWRAALDQIRDSDFLLGRGKDGWKVDLDFLLRADKFTKVMEGSYAGRKHRRGDGWLAAMMDVGREAAERSPEPEPPPPDPVEIRRARARSRFGGAISKMQEDTAKRVASATSWSLDDCFAALSELSTSDFTSLEFGHKSLSDSDVIDRIRETRTYQELSNE